MSVDEERLVAIAASLSDGARIDWDSVRATLSDPGERSLLAQLECLERIGMVHAAPDSWAHLEIVEKIGAGGFGEVFRAHDPKLQREVALKLYHTTRSTAAGRSGDRLREGRLLARIRHANVVTVFGADDFEGRVGIWMELVRGRTLQEILDEQGPFGAREAGLVGLDLARGLGVLHRAGLVHRDVKAQNVIRESGGRIVLMDLGLGEELREEKGNSGSRALSGTPAYMAPELLQGEDASPQSDLYALGVLLFHLVTGAYPHDAKTLPELIASHARGRPALLRDLRHDLPEAFVATVERALAAAPEERFASAGAMESALAAGLGSPGRLATEGAPRGRFAIWAHTQQGAWALGSAATLVVAGAVALATLTHERPTGSALLAAGPPSLVRRAELYRMGALVGEDLATGDRVRPGDRLYLELEAVEPVHVYVFNRDKVGDPNVLFPLEGTLPVNPLPAGSTQRLPGTFRRGGAPASWRINTAGGEETFLVVASKTRLVPLEDEIAHLEHARLGLSADDAQQANRPRGAGTVVEMDDPARGDDGARLATILRDLASGKLSGQSVWIKEVVLQNPGTAESRGGSR